MKWHLWAMFGILAVMIVSGCTTGNLIGEITSESNVTEIVNDIETYETIIEDETTTDVNPAEPENETELEPKISEPTDPCEGITCPDSVAVCGDGYKARCDNICKDGMCPICTPSCYGHETEASSLGEEDEDQECKLSCGICEEENVETCTCDFIVPCDDGSYDRIRIASWNVENWGKTKSSDPERMRKIADIIKEYNIIAIQEISNVREQSDPGCPRNENDCPGDNSCGVIRQALVKYLNEENDLSYEFVFSPQVKDERYLFIYDPSVVTFQGAELINDPGDSQPICDSSPISTGKMVRQPFKGLFKAGGFDFVLLTAHTSPSINVQELEGLEYFYRQVEAEGEPDVIVLGDLNADCSYLKPFDSVAFKGAEYIWVVDDSSDTTTAKTDCAYDRFIFKGATQEDFTGNWGIITDVPDDVSDHYLVWAEFYTAKDSR